MLTNKNLHAWTEVFFGEIGWVPFDATPAAGVPGSVRSAGPRTRRTREKRDAVGPADVGRPPNPGEPLGRSADRPGQNQGAGPATTRSGRGGRAGAVVAPWLLFAPALRRWALRRVGGPKGSGHRRPPGGLGTGPGRRDMVGELAARGPRRRARGLGRAAGHHVDFPSRSTGRRPPGYRRAAGPDAVDDGRGDRGPTARPGGGAGPLRRATMRSTAWTRGWRHAPRHSPGRTGVPGCGRPCCRRRCCCAGDRRRDLAGRITGGRDGSRQWLLRWSPRRLARGRTASDQHCDMLRGRPRRGRPRGAGNDVSSGIAPSGRCRQRSSIRSRNEPRRRRSGPPTRGPAAHRCRSGDGPANHWIARREAPSMTTKPATASAGLFIARLDQQGQEQRR